MPNVLVLSFEGFSFSARQLYEQLLPKLLSRAVVHESVTIQDALSYIYSGWPTVILVTDAEIATAEEDSQRLLASVADYTKQGHTTILMGFFASSVEPDTLNKIFSEHFGLRWEVSETANHKTVLATPEESIIRTESLIRSFYPEAVYLHKVPPSHAIYVASASGTALAYAAFGKVGLGKLGYIGDVYYGTEPERTILAMAHLDRPEDSLEEV